MCIFFFSSRRRHTRFDCDWSSDVCSSDLVGELTKLGLMKEAGLKVFNEREAKREYSYEQTRTTELAPEYAKEFRTNRKAWTFFEAQAPSYQRTLKFWVMNARKEETQRARLKKLIDTSAAGKRVT